VSAPLPRNLFISGLTELCDKDYLKEQFQKFGGIEEVFMYYHEKKFLGSATIRYADPLAAKQAHKSMKDAVLMGIKISLQLDASGTSHFVAEEICITSIYS
jgi:hypothetical protein